MSHRKKRSETCPNRNSGGRGWQRTRLGAALTDRPPLPLLVSHAVKVCVVIAVAVVRRLGSRGWRHTWLGAAFADCLLPPWLVDQAVRVCIIVAMDCDGGARGLGLRSPPTWTACCRRG